MDRCKSISAWASNLLHVRLFDRRNASKVQINLHVVIQNFCLGSRVCTTQSPSNCIHKSPVYSQRMKTTEGSIPDLRTSASAASAVFFNLIILGLTPSTFHRAT